MGLRYTESKEKKIYAAYGMTVYGVQDKYDWTIYPDRPTENVYTKLRIEKDGKDIIDVYLGNRCIFEENFLRTIDNFLYWIDKDKPDSYDIEQTVFKCLCQADSLFNYRIDNRKRKEQWEAEYEKRRSTIIAEEKRKLDLIREYCRKKNLIFKQRYEKIYLIKILNEKVSEMIVNADNDKLEWMVNFMHEHLDNTDAVIVFEGELDEIMRKIA